MVLIVFTLKPHIKIIPLLVKITLTICRELLDGSEAQEAFIKLNGVNTIAFRGCSFKHQWRDGAPHYTNRGTGIYSENSAIYITLVCLDAQSPCTHQRNTIFENLTRGVYAMNSGMSNGVFITDALFFDNYQGLYLSGFTGIANARVFSSTFRNNVPSIWSYGMYLNECSEFHIENNEFYETAEEPVTIGLIVNNSGTNSNEIYRNTFHNLKFATISQNENRNYDPPLHLGGLCYWCNKFVKSDLTEPNRFDFAITYEGPSNDFKGIAKNQGSYISGSSFAPAGNMFQPTPASSHYDFYNEGNSITYYYPSNTTLPYRLIPTNIFPLLSVLPVPVGGSFDESYCPSTISGSGHSTEDLGDFVNAQTDSDSLGQVLTTLVDGGSTTLLNIEVLSSTPTEALQIRSELLAESPYLSDSVLKTSVSKEDVLDNVMIRDVLIANPQSAKLDEIINMLEYRINPMPDYLMEQILAGEDTLGAKEILEANKAWWDVKAAKSYTRLLNYYKGDSVTPAKDDSLNWLFSYRNTLSSFYDKAVWYHSKSQFNQANTVLSTIPGMFTLTGEGYATHNAFTDFFLLAEQIYSDTTASFAVDSLASVSLESIAESDMGVPGAYSRNLLLSAGKITYQEPIILPDTNLKQSKKPKFRGVKEPGSSSRITVYPNPADDYFILKFNLENRTENGVVNLYDMTGKIVKTFDFAGKQDQIICSASDLKSGLYVLSFTIPGRQPEYVKISILK